VPLEACLAPWGYEHFENQGGCLQTLPVVPESLRHAKYSVALGRWQAPDR
jgi:hypothetical protein